MVRMNVVNIFVKKNDNDRIIDGYCVKLVKKCDHIEDVFIRQQEAEKKGNLSFLPKNEKKIKKT